jgi:hypothetical protein
MTLDPQFDRIDAHLAALKWLVGANLVLTMLSLAIVLWLSATP